MHAVDHFELLTPLLYVLAHALSTSDRASASVGASFGSFARLRAAEVGSDEKWRSLVDIAFECKIY